MACSIFLFASSEKVKAATLVFDPSLYPRETVNPIHVYELQEVMRAGVTLPPVLIDKATKKIIDGVHRTRATIAEYGDNSDIAIAEKSYDSEKEMLLDAIRHNAQHGLGLSPTDQARCLAYGAKMGIATTIVNAALSITNDRAEALLSIRKMGNTSRLCSVKTNTHRQIKSRDGVVYDMPAKPPTAGSLAASKVIRGQDYLYYAKALTDLVKDDGLEDDDDDLFEALRELHSEMTMMFGIDKC
mgnify:CR=1 FL=1